MKVVVIGNGESALNNKNGEFIDSCDRVIRINKFVINGYEEYVGTKVDVYCAKWHKIIHRKNDFLQLQNEFWFPYPEPPTMWGALGGIIQHDVETHTNYLKQKNIENKQIKFLPNVTRESLDKNFKGVEPSVGVVAIEMAMHYFDNYDVYITGFDGMQTGWYWDRAHDCTSDCRNSIIYEKMYFNKLKCCRLDD